MSVRRSFERVVESRSLNLVWETYFYAFRDTTPIWILYVQNLLNCIKFMTWNHFLFPFHLQPSRALVFYLDAGALKVILPLVRTFETLLRTRHVHICPLLSKARMFLSVLAERIAFRTRSPLSKQLCIVFCIYNTIQVHGFLRQNTHPQKGDVYVPQSGDKSRFKMQMCVEYQCSCCFSDTTNS